MQMAPKGAVIRIERTARVRISSPIGCHSVRPYLRALSRKIGPRAACTVALGIQAKAMKIFSLVLRLPQVRAKMTGSRMIHILVKEFDTGLWSPQPSLLHCMA